MRTFEREFIRGGAGCCFIAIGIIVGELKEYIGDWTGLGGVVFLAGSVLLIWGTRGLEGKYGSSLLGLGGKVIFAGTALALLGKWGSYCCLNQEWSSVIHAVGLTGVWVGQILLGVGLIAVRKKLLDGIGWLGVFVGVAIMLPLFSIVGFIILTHLFFGEGAVEAVGATAKLLQARSEGEPVVWRRLDFMDYTLLPKLFFPGLFVFAGSMILLRAVDLTRKGEPGAALFYLMFVSLYWAIGLAIKKDRGPRIDLYRR